MAAYPARTGTDLLATIHGPSAEPHPGRRPKVRSGDPSRPSIGPRSLASQHQSWLETWPRGPPRRTAAPTTGMGRADRNCAQKFGGRADAELPRMLRLTQDPPDRLRRTQSLSVEYRPAGSPTGLLAVHATARTGPLGGLRWMQVSDGSEPRRRLAATVRASDATTVVQPRVRRRRCVRRVPDFRTRWRGQPLRPPGQPAGGKPIRRRPGRLI